LYKLRPDADVNNLILHLLGQAERRYGILLRAFQFTSNHFHLVVTDPRRKLPRFMQWLNSLLARAINCLYHEQGEFWRRRPYSSVRLPKGASTVIEKCAYTISNVTTAGLVKSHRDWPGVTSFADDGTPYVFRAYKPDFFFSKTNDRWPESVEFTTQLPEVDGKTPAEVAALIRAEVDAAEAEACDELAQQGKSFLGADAVLKQDREGSPRRLERWGQRNPRFAGRGAWYYAMLDAEREFRERYRTALRSFCAGRRRTPFPLGTWQMVVLFRVRTSPAVRGLSA
jgi:REP element-mobilizing transposase RayT